MYRVGRVERRSSSQRQRSESGGDLNDNVHVELQWTRRGCGSERDGQHQLIVVTVSSTQRICPGGYARRLDHVDLDIRQCHVLHSIERLDRIQSAERV